MRLALSASLTANAPAGINATAFTLSLSSASGTNGTSVTVFVTPNGAIPVGGASVTLAASNGGTLGATSLSFTSGSTLPQSTTLTRSATGSSTVTMSGGGGLTLSGNGQTFTSSSTPVLILTGPTSGLARTTSTPFTVSAAGTLTGTVVVTLSDGDTNSRFYSLDAYDAAGTVTISPANPTRQFYYAPASAGSKAITSTNNGGLTLHAPVAYTATAAVGSSTPFRLTRGGTTIGSYARLQQCRDAGWQSGDVVKVAAGTYAMADDRYDVGTFTVRDNYPGGIHTGVNIDTLTIEAEDMNDPPFIDGSWWCAAGVRSGGQPQFVTAGIPCHNITLRGIRMRGSPAPQGSTVISAAFWQLTDYPDADGAAATFTFDRCLFTGWGDAIKARYHLSTSFYVNSCVFIDNSDAAAGLHHDIYTGNNALTEVVGCTFIRTGTAGYKQGSYGHFVKSRCRTTRVKANRFFAYMDAEFSGGANSLINTPCGGVVEVTGNILIDYGAQSNGSAHNILRSAEQQFPTSGEPSTDPLLDTHSYLIAQNITLQKPGYAVLPGNEPRVLALYHIPSNDPNGTVVSTGVPTYAMTGSGTMVPVTTVVRNNIVGHYDSAKLSEFLAQYPNNTTASMAEVSDLGYYSGGTVAGDPLVNDAALEWAGDYLVPLARTDTNRGGRSAYVPSWVPATAWQWTNIPSSTWDTYMVSNGSGIAPDIRSSTGDAGPTWNYQVQWGYSGPCYSRKNHEVWFFGGGHAGTTSNPVVRWNLAQESPDMTMISAPTSVANRNAWLQAETWRTTGYHVDGKPASPHSYYNNIYSDSTDEFISFGIAGIATGYPIASGGTASFPDVAAVQRNGAWRADGYYGNVTTSTSDFAWRCPRVESIDGAVIYYWDGQPQANTVTLRKFVLATNVHSTIGASVVPFYSSQADTGHGYIGVIGGADSAAGWQVKFATISNGATVDVTVSGDSISSGLSCFDMDWCEAHGYFVSVWVNSSAMFGVAAVSTMVVATITPTGASTATASIKTMTGAAPTMARGWHGVYYDPTYDAVIVVSDHSQPLKTFKVN
jgi:hypothetical protein